MLKKLYKIIPSAAVIWTSVTGLFLGGVVTTWWLSQRLQYGIGFVVLESSDGIKLNGQYVINSWLIFAIINLLLLSVVLGLSLLRENQKNQPDGVELQKVRLLYEDLLNCAGNVTATSIYPEPGGRPRVDIEKMRIRHVVEPDGTTHVTRSYVLACPRERAHVFEIWIEADDESAPVEGFRPLALRVEDKTSGKELDWLPTEDSLRRKTFAIFFPEILTGVKKEIEVHFRWPSYMRRILDKGSTEFWWAHKAASENATADVTYEWLYRPGFPLVRTRLRGPHGETARLNVSHSSAGICWIYSDPYAQVDKRDYAVVIEKDNLS